MENAVAVEFPGVPEKIAQLVVASVISQIVIKTLIAQFVFQIGIKRHADTKTGTKKLIFINVPLFQKQFFQKTLIALGDAKKNERIIVQNHGIVFEVFQKIKGVGEIVFLIGIQE